MNSAAKIKLNSFDDLLGLNENKAGFEQVQELALSDLHSFKNHPFKVLDDEKMQETVESIRERGILIPGIARPRAEGGYEIIAGHRRKHGCELLGIATMPMFVRNYTDDEATIIMVDSNIQRENIAISEKAKAYRMKYDAMKHQGTIGGTSLEEMSKASGESRKTIQRLISLSYLSDELLALIDCNKLGITQGVDFSVASLQQQEIIVNVMRELGVIATMKQSAEIKAAIKAGIFDELWLRDLLMSDRPLVTKVVLSRKKLDAFFPSEISSENIEKIILKLLNEWKENGGSL